MNNQFKGFVEFIREQGVIGLAIGLVLGIAVKDVVNALVTDFINPVIGLLIGGTGNLDEYHLTIRSVTFAWGHFLGVLIDFIIISAVIFYLFKGLKLDKLDKKKS